MSTTIRQLLQQATEQLTPVSKTARLDAEVLLAHILKKERVYFLTWPEKPVDPSTQQHYMSLLKRRTQGEPVAYIIGSREFWTLHLSVNTDTLIPRPETEILVQESLHLLREDTPYDIVDLGSGSGAIALAIASERPLCHIVGVDQSTQAVQLATENARQLALDNVTFQQGDWLAGFADHSVDMIVSNPPYVAAGDPHMSEGDVRFEPTSALLAGPEGLDAYIKILPEAQRCLRPKSWLLMEHGYDQQDRLGELMAQSGFRDIHGIKDFSGQPRVIMGHT